MVLGTWFNGVDSDSPFMHLEPGEQPLRDPQKEGYKEEGRGRKQGRKGRCEEVKGQQIPR
jgi:hypothetical protein